MASGTSVTATTSATASAFTPGCTNLYESPAKDASCAMPYSEDHIKIMSACCKDAELVSYYDDCGLYCLAQGQNVTSLTKCLYNEGAEWSQVFCEGNGTATATGSVSLAASATASVISKETSDTKATGSGTASGSSSSSTSESSDSAAGMSQPQSGLNVVGVTIGVLLITSTVFGAFQI